VALRRERHEQHGRVGGHRLGPHADRTTSRSIRARGQIVARGR
jgi:hypothetical protein